MSKTIVGLGLVAVFFMIATPTLAQRRPAAVETLEIKQQVQQAAQDRRLQVRDQVQDRQEDFSAERCRRIESNFANRFDRYEANTNLRKNRYTHVVQILQALIERADKAGLDTSELELVTATLEEKVTAYSENQLAVVEAARALHQYSCEESSEEFKAKLEALQAQVRETHQSALEAKEYYQNTVKPGVRALKSQVDTN